MPTSIAPVEHVIQAEDVSVFYGEKQTLFDVSLSIRGKAVYALIGPSGCGKSTLLRSFNRMNDFIPEFRMEGKVRYRGHDVYDNNVDPMTIRRQVGMVFQKPNPFPTSIFKNITWGPKINGFDGDEDELVERSLRRAALWDEVKDRLHDSGLSLSGGQQQRLCIARTIAMDPDVILMDEPCASLDPASTARIEGLIKELRQNYCILIVTHNMQQAARVSDFTAFMYEGKLVEFGLTDDIFSQPSNEMTLDYVNGKFG